MHSVAFVAAIIALIGVMGLVLGAVSFVVFFGYFFSRKALGFYSDSTDQVSKEIKVLAKCARLALGSIVFLVIAELLGYLCGAVH